MFGNPETTTGGMALKFYSSVRIDVRRIQSFKLGSEIIGNRTRARVIKNKVAAPFRTAEFDIMYNEGISKLGDLIDVGTEFGIITKSGAWYTIQGERVQGREGLKKLLNENEEMFKQLETDVKKVLNISENESEKK